MYSKTSMVKETMNEPSCPDSLIITGHKVLFTPGKVSNYSPGKTLSRVAFIALQGDMQEVTIRHARGYHRSYKE